MVSVSVVIPTHNHGAFLPFAIESVRKQTYGDWEIIVVDDGSQDATAEVMKRFLEDRRVRYFRQDAQGAPAARNRGITEARAEFLAFLDADDWWDPRKLERQMSFVRDHPDADVVATWCLTVDPQGRAPVRFEIQDDGIMERLIRNSNVLAGSASSCLVRLEALRAVGGFDPSLSYCEDWDLWLRMGVRGRIRVLPEVLTFCRRSTTSHRMDYGRIESSIRRVYARIESTEGLPGHLRRRGNASRAMLSVARGYLRTGHYGSAMRLLGSLAWFHPVASMRALAIGLRQRRQAKKGVVVV